MTGGYLCSSRLLVLLSTLISISIIAHDDVIKWKHFPRYWPFVRGIHRSSVNSPHKGQWRGALIISLICFWTNGWVNKRGANELKHHRAHYDVIVMSNFVYLMNSVKVCNLLVYLSVSMGNSGNQQNMAWMYNSANIIDFFFGFNNIYIQYIYI